MGTMRSRMLAAAVSAVGVVGLAAGAAGAAPTNGGTEHTSFPAAGAVFECSGATGDITAVSGTVNSVFHWNVDQQGIFHETGTIVPLGVTLVDENGNTYSASGASWFGGKAIDENTPIVFTDTEHFVLRNTSTGGIVKVQIVSHLSQNGDMFTMDKGACEPPED